MNYTRTAVLLVGALAVVGGVVALVPGGSATASVTGTTQTDQATIEGTGDSGIPETITVSAAGSYDWEGIDATNATVSVYVGDGSAGNENHRIGHAVYDLDGHSGTSATFENVGGDLLDAHVATGYGARHFMQDFDGESKQETVPVEIRVSVCGPDDCTQFVDQHDVTVIIHNPPSTTPTASVNGTTAVSGSIEFEGENTSGESNVPTCFTASPGTQKCAS